MEWDGNERRKEVREFCGQHINLATSLAKIEQSIASIEKEITQGVNFKTAMVTSLIGIIVTIIIQVSIFAFLNGKISNQVEVNSSRLLIIEKAINAK